MPRETTTSERCKALWGDGRTPCDRVLPKDERRKGWRFCPTHYEQYKQATASYKKVSARTEKLKHTSSFLGEQLAAGNLRRTSLIDSAILVVRQWQVAIAEEIQLRELQHKRFFPNDEDAAHREWLNGLAEDRTKAKDLLLKLQTSRKEVVTALAARSSTSRPPAGAPAAIPAPPPPAPRLPTTPAVLARTPEVREQRVRLLQPPHGHVHYDACNHGQRVEVDMERQQQLVARSEEGITCADGCFSAVCLVMFGLLVWLLCQVLIRWRTYGVY
ncbi:hypothetical protein C8T65DRAFT_672425 [Cerioporus squamosus]|nr:hypothetical protein C8T65DRAFT_672425 [Cerioporus squamosus]